MGTHFSRTWCWPVLGLVIAALVGGCGRPSSPPQPRPAPITTTSTTPPAPVKYNFAQLPSCETIHEEVPGLPPLERMDDSTAGLAPGRSCTFRGTGNDESWAELSVNLWEYSENALGPQPGSKRAKEYFLQRATPRDEQASGLGVGAEARWADPDRNRIGCRLEFLDDNALLSVFYISNKNDPPRGEQCRTRATDLAKQLYSAIQPQ